MESYQQTNIEYVIHVGFIATGLRLISFFTEVQRNFHLTKNFGNIQRHCVCIIKWNSSFNEIWAGHKHQNGNLHKSLEQTHEIKYIPLPQLKTKQCPEFAKNIFLTVSFNELEPNEIRAGPLV